MSAITNPIEQCRKDFENYKVQYKNTMNEVFGNKWSDAEIDKQLESWFPMWQYGYADGMRYMQNLREDDVLIHDDLNK